MFGTPEGSARGKCPGDERGDHEWLSSVKKPRSWRRGPGQHLNRSEARAVAIHRHDFMAESFCLPFTWIELGLVSHSPHLHGTFNILQTSCADMPDRGDFSRSTCGKGSGVSHRLKSDILRVGHSSPVT